MIKAKKKKAKQNVYDSPPNDDEENKKKKDEETIWYEVNPVLLCSFAKTLSLPNPDFPQKKMEKKVVDTMSVK